MKSIRTVSRKSFKEKEYGEKLLEYLDTVEALKVGKTLRIPTKNRFKPILPVLQVFNTVLSNMQMNGEFLLIIEM